MVFYKCIEIIFLKEMRRIEFEEFEGNKSKAINNDTGSIYFIVTKRKAHMHLFKIFIEISNKLTRRTDRFQQYPKYMCTHVISHRNIVAV